MSHFVTNFVSWVIFATVISADSFPSDIQQCTHSDNECLSSVITNILRTHYSKGHRGLNIIPFDPLHIKSLVLPKIADSPVNVEFKFTNIDLAGLSQAIVTKVSAWPKEAKDFDIEMSGLIPKITITGPYNVEGRVLILPITGEGNSEIILEELNAIIKTKVTPVEKDGKTYIKVVKSELDLKPKKVSFYLENLFNGDKVLGENMNKFLNENWEDIYNELKPVIEEAIGKIVSNIADAVYSKYAYNELFLPS